MWKGREEERRKKGRRKGERKGGEEKGKEREREREHEGREEGGEEGRFAAGRLLETRVPTIRSQWRLIFLRLVHTHPSTLSISSSSFKRKDRHQLPSFSKDLSTCLEKGFLPVAIITSGVDSDDGCP